MNRKQFLASLLTVSSVALAAWTPPANAGTLPPDVQAKVEKAKKRLVELAANPAIVAAVREANTKGNGGMTNGMWVDLADGDAPVKAILTTPVSVQIAKWEKEDDTVNKILLRDHAGNLVGASVRPLIYNNASRPVFSHALKEAQPWAADEIKPDTSTQIPSVHVAAPVLDGGKAIGVLHSAVTAK